MSRRNLLSSYHLALLIVAGLLVAGCEDDSSYARVFQIEAMAQTIGGPAAAARPGDYLLENDQLRAAIHGRHNQRSTFPISNGSLMDLDLQRPQQRFGNGQGKDAFYELGPMVNLKVNNAVTMGYGPCTMNGSTPSVGAAPCPCEKGDSDCKLLTGCVRVTATGKGENILGILGLLDMAILRSYTAEKLEIVTDYDVCPGEPFVRVANTARFSGQGTATEMDELKQRTGLMDVLLGEHTGKACVTAADCNPGEACEKLLIEIKFGTLSTQMRRCRTSSNRLAGVLAGDFILFSGKVRPFISGSGFDHESYIRSVFDAGGDVFGAPLSRAFVAAVGDDVSYAYFNADGEVMIPVFAEAFTASMTNRYACEQSTPDCIKGKELRFRRYVSVGKGDVASALVAFYKVRRIPTGQVEGHVIDQRTQQPLSKIDVFVFNVPKNWSALTDAEVARHTYDDLVTVQRKETATTENPDGEVGLASHFRSDIGLDQVPDGSFGGPLPEGRYILVARAAERPASPLVPLKVEVGKTARTTVIVGEPAVIRYQVQDPSGRAIPCKLTIGHCFPECARDEDCSKTRPVCETATRLCVPSGGYTDASTCRPDQLWGYDDQLKRETCRCPTTGLLPLALGGERRADNTVRVELSSSGSGEIRVEPGFTAYQVIVSRGFEYEITRHFVTPKPSVPAQIRSTLVRSVDTRGWIAADFHVHGPNSVDSGLDHDTRIRSYAAEGVELVSASDHDYLTDYAPTIAKLNLRQWLKSQTGLEVSTLDYGHFIGFPLRFDENAELNGAFHWRRRVEGGTPPNDWENVPPGDIFTKLREIGLFGLQKTVVFAAHYYDYFTFYDVDPWTLEMPMFSVSALYNKTLGRNNFSGEFDALEGFNGKNYDIIRRPTYKEIVDYNQTLATFLAQSKNLSYDERQRQWGALSAAAQRAFLHRTKAEQVAALSFSNTDFACRCTADGECGQGGLCDEITGSCVSGCSDDNGCDATAVTGAREKCQPKPAQTVDPTRRTCQRVTPSCALDGECTFVWKKDTKEYKEKCLARDATKPTVLSCELPCKSDDDCAADPLRAVCGAAKVCTAPTIVAATPTDPCPTVRGTIDDWFQLLNHGVRRPMLGNSDSHGTYGTEAGIPRNYVRSEADLPEAIQPEEIAAQVKKMQTLPTYGPFVELSLNGRPMGSIVAVTKGDSVSLGVRVQSPLWFDIDRIEVYRNGELIREVTGRADCAAGPSADCIRVPNDKVLKYEGTIVDKPGEDAWYVVIAMGLDGKSLAPVYSSTPVARLGMYELIQRLTPLLPPLRAFRTPLSPSMSVVRPYTVTNPVWADVGGDGLVAPLPLPSWAPSSDTPSTTSPLRQTPPDHALSHDHRNGLGRLRGDAQQQLRQMTARQITPQMFQKALDSLRYTSFR
jgi:hypothetical protein